MTPLVINAGASESAYVFSHCEQVSSSMASSRTSTQIAVALLAASFVLFTISGVEADAPLPRACKCNQQSENITFYLHFRNNVDTFVFLQGSAGGLTLFDSPVTTDPEDLSTEIARAKGSYTFLTEGASSATDSSIQGLEFVFTVVFNDTSPFGRSSLSYRGYDRDSFAVREGFVITGGNGIFKLAQGWTILSTYFQDVSSSILRVTSNIYYGGY